MKSVGKMGKYIKKTKLDGESIALMDVSPSSLGVLTRAKSLALQRRLQKPSPSPSSASPSKQKTADCGGGGSYLQLRSRRLQKKPPIVVIRRRKMQQRRVRNPNSQNPQNQDSGRGSVGGDGSRSDSVGESGVCGKAKDFSGEINIDELQGSERTTRESTPCSLVRKPESITSPGSSPKLNNGASDNSNDRDEIFSDRRGHVPTTPEMDEFFSGAEEEQQKQFIEKYNFDPVNEQPLPGRYEWKKVDD